MRNFDLQRVSFKLGTVQLRSTEYRSRQNRLVGRKNRQTYQLGDSVQVRVINVDVLRNQIDLEVISQGSDGSTEPESSEPLPVALSER